MSSESLKTAMTRTKTKLSTILAELDDISLETLIWDLKTMLRDLEYEKCICTNSECVKPQTNKNETD